MLKKSAKANRWVGSKAMWRCQVVDTGQTVPWGCSGRAAWE